MLDLGAEHLQAELHEGRKARPALGRDEVAVARRAIGSDVDIDAAGQRDFRLAILESSDLAATNHAIHRDQDLHAVADGEDRLAGLVEVADERLHALVDADVFRSAATGTVDGVIVGRVDLRKGLVEDLIMTELLV